MPDLVIIDRHIYGVRKELPRPLRRRREAKPEARVVLGLRFVDRNLSRRVRPVGVRRRVGSRRLVAG